MNRLNSDDREALADLRLLLEQRIAEADRSDVDTRSFAEIAEAALDSDTRA